ncbi:WxcM-like domain-containing protein [Psychroserpens sp.]|uniref:WxcM-like domain-containing protein n=1 Tax=Psychroserpens sp. TaxID=2020870 RepID=UPI001B06B8F1|nr:WxcM-like domain-containing protein [Psychroserpens sp.]MBO6606480.1 WxcM-like domain-containing protein [Psychroserpens sp.]MBO6631123.1 WxcM-like domain-containing protein [Psychroserpens sp.]MBO6653184.1 WxcM-like domain-containing protein [Psychroserpens sp.]MBO6680788.1 WxcM-like domain-containing protein [Psychroserpens sp.]MBO6750254.1 WxcM-like domain-containing protein [Psychroserpens sp.]
MNPSHQLIKGEIFKDNRGLLSSINDFDLSPIVRFYEIAPKDSTIVRAWQAHKKESKWFYCSKGAFQIKLIRIDDFDAPSDELKIETIYLNEGDPHILHVPGGYANGFKSEAKDSKLVVFSDYGLEASKDDDYRYDHNQWITKW